MIFTGGCIDVFVTAQFARHTSRTWDADGLAANQWYDYQAVVEHGQRQQRKHVQRTSATAACSAEEFREELRRRFHGVRGRNAIVKFIASPYYRIQLTSLSSRRNEPTPMPSVGTKLEGLLMDEFEEDFNPRAYETAANGLANHQSNNNPLLNGQVSSGTNFFSQSNGTTNPPPLCKCTRYSGE